MMNNELEEYQDLWTEQGRYALHRRNGKASKLEEYSIYDMRKNCYWLVEIEDYKSLIRTMIKNGVPIYDIWFTSQ